MRTRKQVEREHIVKLEAKIEDLDSWLKNASERAEAFKKARDAARVRITELETECSEGLMKAVSDRDAARTRVGELEAEVYRVAAERDAACVRIAGEKKEDVVKEAIVQLLSELPPETVCLRTPEGDTFTADELRQRFERGDEIGRQFASDLLRIARDTLARRANAGTELTEAEKQMEPVNKEE